MGLTGTGIGGQVHSAPGDHRLHQRHRARDREHAAPDFLGLTIDVPGEFIGRVAGDRGQSAGDVARQRAARRGHAGAADRVEPLRQARAGLHRGACSRAPPRRSRSISMWRRSDRDSAAFRPGLPQFQVPAFQPQLILTLLSPALTVAMLGAIESLLSAVVADRMGGDRHNPNTELFAQGVANIVSPLFGGLPATGALARTATNIRSGARSPVAGNDPRADAARHPAVRRALRRATCRCRSSPRSCSSSPGTWASGARSREIWKQTYADVLVWLATFLLTVLADLTVAVEVGMVMAALLFIRRVSADHDGVAGDAGVHRGGPPAHPAGQGHSGLRGDLPHPRPFLFGATDKLHDIALRPTRCRRSSSCACAT